MLRCAATNATEQIFELSMIPTSQSQTVTLKCNYSVSLTQQIKCPLFDNFPKRKSDFFCKPLVRHRNVNNNNGDYFHMK